MKKRRRLDLVQVIKRWDNLPHQRAALNILQEVLPPELLDPQAEWIEILDSFINPALANIDDYYFKDIVPDKLSMPEDLKLKPIHYARLYTHKTRLSKIAKRYSR